MNIYKYEEHGHLDDETSRCRSRIAVAEQIITRVEEYYNKMKEIYLCKFGPAKSNPMSFMDAVSAFLQKEQIVDLTVVLNGLNPLNPMQFEHLITTYYITEVDE
eukprot:scaffold299746_cov35-Tisochrysis_lutea.AAC.3